MESVEMASSATKKFARSNPHIAKRRRTGRSHRTALSSSHNDSDLKPCIPSEEEDRSYDSTVTAEEEEDMANCLIMLARGGRGHGVVFKEEFGKSKKKRKISGEISISPVSGGYECKTCDKGFVSFQALGGHRASHHKKARIDNVKPSVDQVQMLASFTEKLVNITTSSSSSSSLSVIIAHSTKFHECAICGSGFSSGQALGGHMRRHRTTAVSSISAAFESSNKETAAVVEKIAMNNSINNSYLLSLDLNLPAPDEEDDAVEDHNRRFHQQFSIGIDNGNSATTAALGFSAPPLVGCHF